MLKKNTRKRLLAGALATVMMLTMCPSWALADDEDIALLPANEEIAVPVVDSTPAADPTKTPAVPLLLNPRQSLPRIRIPHRLRLKAAQTAIRTARSLAITTLLPTFRKTILRTTVQQTALPDVNNQPQDAADIRTSAWHRWASTLIA